MLTPISVLKYNNRQDQQYQAYIRACKSSKLIPAPQTRYFPKVAVKYGYVIEGQCNALIWRRKKSDFY